MVHWSREMMRYRADPAVHLLSVHTSARGMSQAMLSGYFRLPDVVRRMPFKSFATKKRAFRGLAEVGQLLLEDRIDEAKGLVAQLLRWIAFSLLIRHEEAAWKLVIDVPDPVADTVESVPTGTGLLEQGLQDPRQLTALVGLLKDEGVMAQRLGFTAQSIGGNGSGSGAGGGGSGGGVVSDVFICGAPGGACGRLFRGDG